MYLSTDYYAEFAITPSDKWSFDVSADVVNYTSQNFSENIIIPIINSSVSYNFGKKGKHSLELKAFDLLNKNTSFQIFNQTNYFRQTQRNILGRYFMLSVNMKLGKGKGKGHGGHKGGGYH